MTFVLAFYDSACMQLLLQLLVVWNAINWK